LKKVIREIVVIFTAGGVIGAVQQEIFKNEILDSGSGGFVRC
jgi:hypothetical protein